MKILLSQYSRLLSAHCTVSSLTHCYSVDRNGKCICTRDRYTIRSSCSYFSPYSSSILRSIRSVAVNKQRSHSTCSTAVLPDLRTVQYCTLTLICYCANPMASAISVVSRPNTLRARSLSLFVRCIPACCRPTPTTNLARSTAMLYAFPSSSSVPSHPASPCASIICVNITRALNRPARYAPATFHTLSSHTPRYPNRSN